MRFSILRHVEGARRHFDLFVHDATCFGAESARPLRSFRLDHLPSRARQEARSLPSHRSIYLGYNGPIPGRGYVRTVDRGSARILAADGPIFRICIKGERFAGVLEFVRDRVEPTLWYCGLTQSRERAYTFLRNQRPR